MNKLIYISIVGLLLLNLVVSVSATSPYVLDEDWYIEAVVAVNEAGLMEGTDGIFDAEGTVNRAQLATVLDRNLDYNKAYDLGLAFLQWSMHQELPQEILVDGQMVILSVGEERSDGQPAVFFSPYGITGLKDILAEKDSDEDLSLCLSELYDFGSDLSYCEYAYGEIELSDASSQFEY